MRRGALWCALGIALAGCGGAEEAVAPWRAPIWGEPPGARVTMQAPPLVLRGDLRQGDTSAGRQGFLLYGGRFTTIRVGLRGLSEESAPWLALYGPRADGEVWGRARRTLGAEVIDYALPARGEYLLMVSSQSPRGAGPFELVVACVEGCEGVVACPQRECLEAPCLRGWRNDARGCRSCECLDECESSAECPSDQSCVQRQCRGDCFCAEAPSPVCGIDGQTYESACEARCQGVEVVTSGACPQQCPALECPQSCPAGYKAGPDGCPTCACQDLCALCDDALNPVCTRNGTTAPNACVALCNGEEVAYAGHCVAECGALQCGLSCPEGYRRDARGCEVCECFDEPCQEDGRFVCGVNGVTYGSQCEADRVGVEVALRGACPRLCGQGAACPAPLRCEALGSQPPLACDAPGCVGACVAPSPMLCDDDQGCLPGFWCEEGVCAQRCACSPLYDPACGADGVTYLNACVARCARVGVAALGACCAPGALDGCGLQCDNGFDLDVDGCDICACREVPPCECSPVENPVCGADQRTYQNSCEARCAGQRQWQEGACP